jgi:hypothetical protein
MFCIDITSGGNSLTWGPELEKNGMLNGRLEQPETSKIKIKLPTIILFILSLNYCGGAFAIVNIWEVVFL